MHVQCKIVNPTSMLLTLRTISSGGDWQLTPYDAQWAVTPGESYAFQIPGIPLAGADLKTFDADQLSFTIVLTVEFNDAFEV